MTGFFAHDKIYAAECCVLKGKSMNANTVSTDGYRQMHQLWDRQRQLLLKGLDRIDALPPQEKEMKVKARRALDKHLEKMDKTEEMRLKQLNIMPKLNQWNG